MSEVYAMAIDDVVFVENGSMMYDEVIAHRLGLVPLQTDLDAFTPRAECDCKSELGCNKCTATLTLEAEATDRSVTVYSGELRSETDVKPVSEKIPIARLAPLQRVRLEAYARLGTAREHAKWSPVSACSYKYQPKVTVRRENLANPEEVVRWCPRDVYAYDPQEKIIVKDELACTLCMDCVDHAVPVDPKKPFPVEIEGVDTSFIFYVESTGALPPRRVVKEAASVVVKRSEGLQGLLRKAA
jgi:DNA-directed RNA polymerase subunit D